MHTGKKIKTFSTHTIKDKVKYKHVTFFLLKKHFKRFQTQGFRLLWDR